MKLLIALAGAVSVCVVTARAEALPRFAARNGLRCLKCHVNPGGAGPRNRYGADIFSMMKLPIGPDEPERFTTVDEPDGPIVPFSGAITDWLSVGGDLRLAYFLAAPSEGPTMDEDPRVSTTFFLMQADLYHVAELGSHVTMVLDVGVNNGFEAWALLRPLEPASPVDLIVKAGRFLPAFGLRNVNHSLFTRQPVGLGPAAQDTGVELTVDTHSLAMTIGVYNGRFGDPFDAEARARRTFDKAALARASARLRPGPLALEVGGAVLFNQNATNGNPVFRLPSDLAADGVDELRADAFVIAGLGPFALLADGVFIRDRSALGSFTSRRAIASYTELSMNVLQGLDVLAGFELLRPDLDDRQTQTMRWSVAAELFPWYFTELRAMARYQHGPGTPSDSIFDVVAFLHVYL